MSDSHNDDSGASLDTMSNGSEQPSSALTRVLESLPRAVIEKCLDDNHSLRRLTAAEVGVRSTAEMVMVLDANTDTLWIVRMVKHDAHFTQKEGRNFLDFFNEAIKRKKELNLEGGNVRGAILCKQTPTDQKDNVHPFAASVQETLAKSDVVLLSIPAEL